MAYDLATVTNLGNQLLASVVSDKSSLVIDKIEVSNTQLASSTDLKSMKSISNVVQTLSANGYQKKDNSFIISTVLDNSSVTADYKAWVFGIWAHEADGGSPILMSVITSTSSPDTISKGSGTPIDYNYKFITTFSNTSSLTIQMASDTYATNDTVIHNSGDETATGTKTFQEIKISNNKFPSLVQTDGQYITLDGGNSEMIPADDSKIVHTTGDETIDGQKKFKTDPTDGAGNAYAKTVDVNQQLDKKVNVSDMRKPASDVAGIEEVNAKQDKIGYTPADDSKVVHDNHDGSISVNGASILPANEDVIRRIDGEYTDMNDIPMGWLYLNGWADISGLSNWGLPQDLYYVHCFKTELFASTTIQMVYGVQQNNTYVRTMAGTKWTTWKLLADDSKVAHLSGANNFDTVPTVNNNPLLLASSLPSDLARTGSNQEFTGKNTFDTAPIDKTTGNPYITKDGVPSDVARTGKDANFTAKLQQNGQDVALANNTIYRNPNTGSVSTANTFTAAQTFSIAPTIKDASTDKGDNQAATMADLKSVINSSWRPVKLSSVAQDLNFSTAFYQKNDNTKKFTLIFMGEPNGTKSVFSTPKLLFTDPDIKAFTKLDDDSDGSFGGAYELNNLANELWINLTINGDSLMFTTSFAGGHSDHDPSHYSDLNWYGYQKVTGTYK